MRSNYPTPMATSWRSPPRARSEAPMPSWMAPPAAPEASLTSWAAPAPNARLFASVAPRISLMPRSSYELDDPDRVPPPPSLPSMDGPTGSELESNLVPYEALAVLEERIDELSRGLEAARASVEAARTEALESSEREIVKLAMVIAERVVGRALLADPAIVSAWVREGIEALSEDDSVRCVVSPRVGEILHQSGGFEGLKSQPAIVVDPRMQGIECEIRGKYGRLDGSLKARLDAVSAALGIDRSPVDDEAT